MASRASLHNWTIEPHRHTRLHQFFLLMEGGGTFSIDNTRENLDLPQAINLPPGTVHEFTFNAGIQGWVLTIPSEMLKFPLAESLSSVLSQPLVISVDHDLVGLFQRVNEEYQARRFGRNHTLHSLCMLLACQVARTILDDGGGRISPTEHSIVSDFENMVDHNFRHHWTLATYASELAISTTHLTRLTRLKLGIPASKVIENRVIQEARRELVYTDMRISAISISLGFADPAYFTRVFTRSTGMSPTLFRAGLQDQRAT